MNNILLQISNKVLQIVFLLLLILFIVPPLKAHATITQLTSDPTAYSFEPRIEGNNVVWQTITASNSSNIFFYDIASGSATQISDNTDYNSDPQISSGQIVWIASGSATKINMYDIASGSAKTIADNVKNPVGLAIESGYVVWGGTNGDDNYAIYLYDIANDSLIQLSDNVIVGNAPQINNGKILWEGFNFFEYEFYVYDIGAKTTSQVNLDVKKYNAYRLNLDRITGFDANDNINVYDLTNNTATTIVTGTTDNAKAQFHSSFGVNYVFWGGFDGEDYHIYAYFMATSVITQLTVNNYNNLNSGTALAASGQRVMWDTPDGVIRVFDNITKTVINLSESAGYTPDISSSGKVVWTVDNADNSQVYIWDGVIPADHAPIITPIKEQIVDEGDLLQFHIETSSADGDNVMINVSSLPPGATYDPDTQIVSWTPMQGQAGNYVITITSKDDETPSEMSVLFVPVGVFEMTAEQKSIFLGAAIMDFALDVDTENTYLSSQQLIYTYIHANQMRPALHELNKFIRQLSSDYENQVISKQAHDELMHEAQTIIGRIN